MYSISEYFYIGLLPKTHTDTFYIVHTMYVFNIHRILHIIQVTIFIFYCYTFNFFLNSQKHAIFVYKLINLNYNLIISCFAKIKKEFSTQYILK